MFLKKPLFIQNINPRAVFITVTFLITLWVLARPLQAIGENIYYFFGTVTNNAFQNIIQSKFTLEDLIKSKSLLEKQTKTISLLKIKINYLEDQIKETENLKELLNLKQNLSYETTCAMVIGRSTDNWHKQIILDRGKNFKIMIGDSVLTKKGIVGQVFEVDKNTSVVQLISDPSYKIGCKVKNKNILGILTGKTNSHGLLEFIPVGKNIMLGDLVITSGIVSEGFLQTYPPGQIIGKISKISKKNKKASDLYIEVKLSQDLSSLSNVLVFSPT